jgi:hypothetical protein
MLDKVSLSCRAKSRSHRSASLSLIAALTLLSGCASSIVVKPNIPSPLVEKLPLNTSMIYSDSFKNYVYLENEKNRNAIKSIDFTEAQTTMFEQVFGSLTNLVELTDPAKNLSIEPEILDFQYSAPSETKLKQYEIWIKYRLKLRNADNARIADWTIKGYGKTSTGMLRSASSAFNSATNIALRDVGAQLSIRFPRQSVVKTLLDGGSPQTIPEPEPEPEESIEVADNDAIVGPLIEKIDQAPSFDQTAEGSATEAAEGSATEAAEGSATESAASLEDDLTETKQEGNDES